MLISFSVANFRSFRDEQTFNLLASKRLGGTEGTPHCSEVPGTGEHVLRVASLYGANGAGKSNLVRAIAMLKRLVLEGTPPGKSVRCQPFLLDDESSTKPTVFELQFLEEDEVFDYGFCYDANRVHEEWLSVYKGKRDRSLFTREDSEDGAVRVVLGPAATDADLSGKLKSLAEVGARPNQLFLTEVMNLDDAKRKVRASAAPSRG